jgi:lysyl-tRNA synthetase class 2
MMFDYSYLEAVEHGMPPMSGWGMGIDRIVCLLTDQDNLKDVVMFPLMRPDSNDAKMVQTLVDDFKKNNKSTTKPAVSASKSTSTSQSFDPGFNREQAVELLTKYVDPALQPHLFFVEAAMRQLALHYGHEQDADLWALAGLLHDVDWSITEPKYNQGELTAHCGPELEKILAEITANPEFV